MSLPAATPEPKTPQLTPVFLINLKLGLPPQSVFNAPKSNKALTLATVTEGEITTVPNNLGLELNVTSITGFDDLSTSISENVNTLDCKLYGKTPEGSGVYVTYKGVVQLTQESIDVITNKSQTSNFDDVYVTNNPKFQFDDLVPDKYRWVLKENLFGKGRFLRADDGALCVQYYVYVVR